MSRENSIQPNAVIISQLRVKFFVLGRKIVTLYGEIFSLLLNMATRSEPKYLTDLFSFLPFYFTRVSQFFWGQTLSLDQNCSTSRELYTELFRNNLSRSFLFMMLI